MNKTNTNTTAVVDSTNELKHYLVEVFASSTVLVVGAKNEEDAHDQAEWAVAGSNFTITETHVLEELPIEELNDVAGEVNVVSDHPDINWEDFQRPETD